MDIWFTEDVHDGWELSVRIERVLVTEKSPYQRIDILETRDFGRMLVLDGKVQACELDEFIYHEMMTHVALMSHPNPRRVLVAGGGDGGAMRESLRHPSVEKGMLVDIDKRVIELCQEYMPSLAASMLSDPRLVCEPADASLYLQKARDLDVVVVDSSDPDGPSEALFTDDFYRTLKRAMSPDGIVCLQAGSPFFYKQQVADLLSGLREVFTHVRLMRIPMPTYPSGNWTLAVASMQIDPAAVPIEELEKRQRQRNIETRYWSPEMQRAALTLPPYLKGLGSSQRHSLSAV